MKTLSRRRSGVAWCREWGFTLIELLVVIVVIAILAGIVIRGAAYVNQKVGRGKAITDMQRIKMALVEFHAKYGVFPPVNSSTPGKKPGGSWGTMDWSFKTNVPWGAPQSMYYSTGLVYYLASWEVDGFTNWKKYIEGIMPNGKDDVAFSNNPGAGWMFWSNSVWTCWDPWDHPYNYVSLPPYQSFSLWSSGPDLSDTNDDIGIQWDE